MIAVTDIQEATAVHYGISLESLIAPVARGKNGFIVSHPRQVAMYLASELSGLSLPKIGKAFGGRDHSTVIHAIGAVEKRIVSEEGFPATLLKLSHSVRARTKRGTWPRHEEQILRDHYPEGGSAAAMKLLPHRTKGAIQGRAKRLGLKAKRKPSIRSTFPKECSSCGTKLRYGGSSKYQHKPPTGLCRGCCNKRPRTPEQIRKASEGIRRAYQNPEYRKRHREAIRASLANMPEEQRETRRRCGRQIGLSGLGNLAAPAGSDTRLLAGRKAAATRRRQALLNVAQVRKAPKTFEEKLQAILDGRASIVIMPRANNDLNYTAGGVSSGWAA